MSEKRHALHSIAKYAEDIALVVGCALFVIGAGGAFGWPYGVMVVGILAIAYGVWITERTR